MSIDCCSSGERCVPEIIGTAQQYMQVTAARACLVRGSVGSSQSCPWVWFGLGQLGRDFSVFGGLIWVGSTTAKVLKN